MRVMTSMELDPEEQHDMVMPIPVAEEPKYPWGLRINLTQSELEKLGLDYAGAQLDGVVHLHALARITSMSCDQTQDGENCRIELQITDMDVESEDDENAVQDAAVKSPRRLAYKMG